MLNNKKIFLTGGTGSFGKAFTELTLKKFKPKELIIYSRDESKQWEMSNIFKKYRNIKFILGDIRDEQRLIETMNGVDYVIHAAATKIVPTAETNPFECIKTNILGSINVINASKKNCVKKVIALSTDKACNPVNLYGSTKLAADKLFIAGNNFSSKKFTTFSIVRYGNVIGSRGSVIPFFKSQVDKGEITITDPSMTRFLLSLEDCVNFTLMSLKEMKGGEIFVKKIPSILVKDIANSIKKKNTKIRYIGIRPGEKIHEEMISKEDSEYTYSCKDFFKIIPSINNNLKYYKLKKNQKVVKNFSYNSENNEKWITVNDLKNWLKKFPNYL